MMELFHQAVGLRMKIVVLEHVMFKREHKTSQMDDMNCAPLSKVIFAGTPNLKIQPEMKALVQSAVEMEARGTAFGQREVLSRMGKK